MINSSNLVDLVADVGGTNTRVGVAVDGTVQTATIRRFKNAGRNDLGSILKEFSEDASLSEVRNVAVALAGPVEGTVGSMTNLNWEINAGSLETLLSAKHTYLLNDLQAQGHALNHLDAANVTNVVSGDTADAGASRLVIGVGTGFNAAPVHNQGAARVVAASECGHARYAVDDSEGMEISAFLADRYGLATVEEALSGRGLCNLYDFYAAKSGASANEGAAWVMQRLADENDPVARAAVRRFVYELGRNCRDLALTHLPHGGMYLVGGVSCAVQPYFEEFGFADAFLAKDRMSSVVERFNISVVTDDFAALTGCARMIASRAA